MMASKTMSVGRLRRTEAGPKQWWGGGGGGGEVGGGGGGWGVWGVGGPGDDSKRASAWGGGWPTWAGTGGEIFFRFVEKGTGLWGERPEMGSAQLGNVEDVGLPRGAGPRGAGQVRWVGILKTGGRGERPKKAKIERGEKKKGWALF